MAAIGKRWLLLLLLIGIPSAVLAAPDTADAVCNSCHKLGDSSPVHAMLNSVHGKQTPDTPMGQKGCAQCHGSSQSHIQSPTRNKPDVSFGPTWSDSVSLQNQACLGCHEKDATPHWNSSLHGQENLSCVTCHDLHTTNTAMTAANQMETCTLWHWVQVSIWARIWKRGWAVPVVTIRMPIQSRW